MYQCIQTDTNILLSRDAINAFEFALSAAETSFVLPIKEDAWKYMLACIRSINGNNFVIIDGVRQDMPDMKTMIVENNRDFLEIYELKVKHIMESAKNYIVIMYERNRTGVFDWSIICPRNGKFYQVGTINAVGPNYDNYEINLSHCVMDGLNKKYRKKSALLFTFLLVKHYFNTNLRNNTDTTTTAN